MANPKVISLYTGVGGLDFGFEAAGFETAIAVEMDRACCRNIRANRNWPVLERDIHDVSSREILQQGGLKPNEADVLIGGPPCQPFSKSGYWVRGDAARLDDPRADTLDAYLRVLRDTRPKAFFLENVPGLVFKGKQEGLSRIIEGLEAINRQYGTNYRPYWSIVNAASFGTPQLRERVVIVGSRDGSPFQFPTAKFGADEKGLPAYRTAWDALGDLPQRPEEPHLAVTGKWADLLPTIPEGQNYLWHTDRGGGEPLFGWRRRYWNFLLKLAKDRPAWTIQAQPGSATGPFHWDNRKLSMRELCRLQTFPDNVRLEGSRTEIQRMVGNAVPSLLAEAIALEIRQQFFAEAHPNVYQLLPPKRQNTPPTAPLAALPKKFRVLIGDHEPHPGEGLGYAAIRRVA